MSNWSIVSGTLSLALFLAVATSSVQGKECPPSNPFCNVWVPCNYTQVQGPVCRDCSTLVICTRLGGWVVPCWVPGRPHCNDKACRAEPSDQCADNKPSDEEENDEYLPIELAAEIIEPMK